jgi:replicative DNA helicase
MPDELISSPPTTSGARTPPYSEEAERGVLGSILLDAMTVMDLCLERQLEDDSFYVPAHKLIFECLRGMSEDNMVVDSLTIG